MTTATMPTDKQREVLEQLAVHDLKITGVTQLGHQRVASAMARSLITKGWSAKEGAALVITDAGRDILNDLVADVEPPGLRSNGNGRAPGKGHAAQLIEHAGEGLQTIPLDQLHPAIDNPRKGLGPEEQLEALADSIKTQGLLQPIIVTPRAEGGYLIVAGHRRHAAAGKAGLTEVTCVVRQMDDDDRRAAMLVENLHRTDLDVFEEAAGYKQLLDLGWTQRKIGQQVGRNQATVSRRLKLLDLDAKVMEKVHAGELELDLAAKLAMLPQATQKSVLKAAARLTYMKLNESVSRELEQRAREAAEAKKRAVSFAKLADAGVTVLPKPGRAIDRWETYKHLTEFHRVPGGGEGHETEPCHAAVVTRDAQIIYGCTNPAAHGELDEDQQRVAEHQVRQQAIKAADEAWDAAWAPRRAWLADRLTELAVNTTQRGSLPTAELRHTALVAGCSVGVYLYGYRLTDLLGLDEHAAHKAVADGTANPFVVAYAAALAYGETATSDAYLDRTRGNERDRDNAPLMRHHLDELGRIGCPGVDVLEQLLTPPTTAEAA